MLLSFVVVADNYSPVKQSDIGGTASSLPCGDLMAYPDCDEQKLSETKMVLMNS
ncbi:hypothetical protein HanRHA438_Chr01g0025561 [Helianthus annuus]|uniref:Uncharacterized protein n=1 Tax=Helianthus annuus TaxID=4232 RepID=A0A9K3JVB5_HELAN|nr:hypothetical protein HanXRQr2_Chr01g0025121 [Helianthus annuus]KAJ0948300.1 hypothetical protein HanRHA438_Chr01g0025561 [Helianthus annuus]KAJ0957187.1 hypothetical protein HanPSC8_Chr01g0024271 [Helianthus annuus]